MITDVGRRKGPGRFINSRSGSGMTDAADESANTTADLRSRALRVLPGGVSSNVRLSAPRIFFERGRGARLWDVEGREYVDYLLGQGPAFLGHSHPAVTAAVQQAVDKGMIYGAQHRLEVEAIEKLLAVAGWADMARLGLSGTEAVHAAVRLARAATGRRRVLRFTGQYHGWLDTVLMHFDADGKGVPASAGQPPDYLADWLLAPFNDTDAVAAIFAAEADDIAAIVLEPMMCNSGAILPQAGFLELLRERCTATGAVLIFDEVITGFRVALGGAVERFGVTPDLAVYGKALGGGWPVSAIAGTAELMELIGTGAVNHSGTFNASVMAAAAVSATMDVLKDDPPYDRIDAHGAALMAGLRELGAEHSVPLHLQGLPAAFHLSFGGDSDATDYEGLRRFDLDRYARFAHRLADFGVWVAERGIWYTSAAHGDDELTDALARVDDALRHGLPD